MNTKLKAMLTLQDSLNRHINPKWVEADYEWYRAIWVECAELMEHYGWKWWKAQHHDMEQIRLELIDIWHFGLSAELMLQDGDIEATSRSMEAQMEFAAERHSPDFRAGVDAIASHALLTKSLNVPVFLQLLAATDADFNDLYRIYVGKNVLNRFRQDHGYKQGTYRKHWSDGREDNEHLSEVTRLLDADAEDFQQQMYKELGRRYSESDLI